MPPSPPPRHAELVLCTPAGRVVGVLPPVPVPTAWWPDVAAVVEAAREAFGVDVVILRLLDTERPRPHGGRVTYLAEIEEDGLGEGARAALLPWAGRLDDQPLRLPYARPGGPTADVAWAEEVLRRRRIERAGRPVQARTWNLSSIWRLPLADGTSAWLKVVPPFFGHEGDVLRRLQGRPVPRLLGHHGRRVLLADVPGDDLYDASPAVVHRMVGLLVELQAGWIGRVPELLAMGLPDWREPALAGAIAALVDRRAAELDEPRRAGLGRFVDGLAARWSAIDDAGLPDTLVHGDFHPGNTRGTPFAITLLDWGDTGVGNPLLDLPAMLAVIEPAVGVAVRERWLDAWRAAVPGSDPARAADALRPVAAARQALIYQGFVDRIEPVERRYHEADVLEWLERAADLAAAEESGSATR